jgi:hypothetical protein
VRRLVAALPFPSVPPRSLWAKRSAWRRFQTSVASGLCGESPAADSGVGAVESALIVTILCIDQSGTADALNQFVRPPVHPYIRGFRSEEAIHGHRFG